MSVPGDLLNRTVLRQLAGNKAFQRGERVFADGRVHQLRFGPDRAVARVQGASRAYRVKIWRSRGDLQFTCECPVGREHVLCKHGVAVGLAWLREQDSPQQSGEASEEDEAVLESVAEAHSHGGTSHGQSTAQETAEPAVAPAELRAYVQSLDKKRLLSLALEAIDYDEILRRRLMLETIGAPQGRLLGEAELKVYRQLLREAIEVNDFVDYDAMPDYVQGIEEALRPLEALLESGQAAAVIELCELALLELERASAATDSSDGSLNGIYDELQRLHHAACLDARPDPAALAARLLEYELEGGLGIFNNAVNTYADVLGPRGLAAYGQLLQDAWNRLPPLRPAKIESDTATSPPLPSRSKSKREAEDNSLDYRRFQLTALVERFAQNSGADVDTRVAIRARDLSSPQDFTAIVQLYRDAGRYESALEWAQTGLSHFPEAQDSSGLREQLIELNTLLGRHEAVATLVWEEFVTRPDAALFRRLKTSVTGEAWALWRERALAHVRQSLADPGKSRARDASALVEILLADGDAAGAFAAAKTGGCRIDLWLEIAANRENGHPAEALEIYRQQLDVMVARGDSRSYQQAAGLLRKIRHLYHRLNRGTEFGAYRETVRATHRHRRGWVKLLDALTRI